MSTPKRVLITGATGFVGAALARRLLADGHHVWALVRANHSTWRLRGVENDLRLITADLGNAEDAQRVVNEVRPDWIFHLAAHGAYPTQTDLAQMVRTNFVSTINLVESALSLGFEAFVNTGSSSEYGFKDHAPSESEWIEPNSHYAVTKASATLYCRYTANARGVNLPTLRLYSIYGAWEEPTRLMPAIVVRGLSGSLPPLVSPTVARDYVFIEDCCEAYIKAATRGTNLERGAVYNVGSGKQTTLGEVVDIARQVFSLKCEPQWGGMEARKWDTSVWVSDNRRICDELQWSAEVDLAEGLRRFADWFTEASWRTQLYKDRMGLV